MTIKDDQIRLNYIIPNNIANDLSDYCDYTGRSAADVIRQLIVDYIDGHINIEYPIVNLSSGKRTNLSINRLVLCQFDKKITTVGTRSGVIARLLNDYLINRYYTQGDDYKDCYKLLENLVEACEARNQQSNGVTEANYWQSLYSSKVFLNTEVELDVS